MAVTDNFSSYHKINLNPNHYPIELFWTITFSPRSLPTLSTLKVNQLP